MRKTRLDKIIEDLVHVARRRIPTIALEYLEIARRLGINNLNEPRSRAKNPMSKQRTVRSMTFGLVIVGVLSGCATFEKCGFGGCTGDATVTADVKALFDKHPELGTAIDAQTLDHVVYLYGLVDTDLEAEIAKSVALKAPGVIRVVSSIAVRNT
jgi:osmotically-inducible protein OsmY